MLGTQNGINGINKHNSINFTKLKKCIGTNTAPVYSVTHVVSLSESYQDIQATLTEMESCMRLLSPEFDLPYNANSSPKSSQPASECPLSDEQPCCSKDLKDYGRDGRIEDKDKKKNNVVEKKGKGNKESRGMTEEKEKKSDDDGRKNEDKITDHQSEKNNEIEKGGTEEEEKQNGKVETAQSEEEEEDEDEEEEASEEEVEDNNMFIRNSGLISHSYNLDVELNPGEYLKLHAEYDFYLKSACNYMLLVD